MVLGALGCVGVECLSRCLSMSVVCFSHVSLGFVLSVSVCVSSRGSSSSLFVVGLCCCRGPWFGPVWRSLVPLGSVRCGVPGVVVCFCCCWCFVVFQLLSLGVESYIGLVGLRRLGRCLRLFCTPLFFFFFPLSSLSVCVYVSVRWLSLGSCLFLPSRGLWLVVVFLSISLSLSLSHLWPRPARVRTDYTYMTIDCIDLVFHEQLFTFE